MSLKSYRNFLMIFSNTTLHLQYHTILHRHLPAAYIMQLLCCSDSIQLQYYKAQKNYQALISKKT